MADIELVIKIDEDDYKRGIAWASAIRNGIPLPKGHGDLIDEKELICGLKNSYLDTFGTERVISVLSELPIIIEADRGE